MREAGAVLKERGKQMIFLTATLAPASEAEFFKIMRMDRVPPIRGPTTRANIQYSVFEHAAEVEQHKAVGQLIQQKLEEYPAPAKIIIYSNSIDTIKELGARLGYPMYYADVGSEKEKAQIQQRWENGTERVAICSNAFGLGIDQPDVRFVGHVGPIFDMENYGQESGRAGRDGQPSEAVIIDGAGTQQALQQQQERRRREPTRSRAIITEADRAQAKRLKVEQFISGASCRRVHLDHELDGRTDRVRCEAGEVRCDVCVEDEQEAAHMAALQRAYMAEQERKARREQDRMLDSGIEVPSSAQATDVPSSPPAHAPTECSPSPVGSRHTVVSSDASSAMDSSPRLRSFGSEVTGSRPQDVTAPDNSPSQSSIASTVSFDQGFLTAVSMADRFEFQSQQRQHAASQAHTRAQVRAESQDVYDLERRLEWWVGRCPVCVVEGEPDSRHPISECQQEKAEGIQQEWIGLATGMRPGEGKAGKFVPFSCCFTCHAPQAICQRWVGHEGGQGRWRKTDKQR